MLSLNKIKPIGGVMLNYSKNVIIQQIQFKYKITKQQAENMYSEFEQSDDIDTLASVVFKPDRTFEPDALCY